MNHHQFMELLKEIECNELNDVFFTSALWLNHGKYSQRFSVLLTPTQHFHEMKKKMPARESINKTTKWQYVLHSFTNGIGHINQPNLKLQEKKKNNKTKQKCICDLCRQLQKFSLKFARLAQSGEHTTFNLRVVNSSFMLDVELT